MEVHDLLDVHGRMRAFEIDNVNVGRREICGIVVRIPGAVVTRVPRLLSWIREEEFCAFSVGSCHFTVSEPFGDNSRYWIGPQQPGPCDEMAIVRRVFLEHEASRFLFSRLFRRFV
jgi:hypothetical protein